MITVEESGTFDLLDKWLVKAAKIDVRQPVIALGQQIKAKVAAKTPVDTGLTAASYDVRVNINKGEAIMMLVNTSEHDFNVVQALRYGHGTGTGGYVPPNDFVTPVVEPLIENATNLIVRSVVE